MPGRDPYATIARFYDRTMQGFDADLHLYKALAARVGGRILELGTGTGRVALALAAAGHEVVGIDTSEAMLAIAQERLKRLRTGDVTLILGDMTAPPVEGPFGLVICARDTFLHLPTLDAQIAMLQSARDLLAPRGRLVLDLPGPAGDWGDWDPGARPFVLDWTDESSGGQICRLTTFRADLAEQERLVTDVFEEISEDGSVRRHMVTYALRFVFPAEMLVLLQLCDLLLEDRYGGYDLERFDAGSERMIVVALKGRAAG
jgi:SAM-dependent methyltransferase